MSSTMQSEIALKKTVDERELIHRKHEAKLAEVNGREDPMPTSEERELLKRYRGELAEYDEQILELSTAVEADIKADEESKKVRRALAGAGNGVEADGDGRVPTRGSGRRR